MLIFIIGRQGESFKSGGMPGPDLRMALLRSVAGPLALLTLILVVIFITFC